MIHFTWQYYSQQTYTNYSRYCLHSYADDMNKWRYFQISNIAISKWNYLWINCKLLNLGNWIIYIHILCIHRIYMKHFIKVFMYYILSICLYILLCIVNIYNIDRCDFWIMWLLEAFGRKSWEPGHSTQFKGAESENHGSQAKFPVFNLLICISRWLPIFIRKFDIHKRLIK